MLKRYDTGKLTPKLFEVTQEDSIIISGYKGPGLRLGDTKSGKVILVGGGTGCFPYYDLIDLLFKAHLVENKHPKSEEILAANPILLENPFDRFQFVLLWAFASEEDIHGLILGQLIELSKGKRVKCVLKIKSGAKSSKGNVIYENRNF